MQIVIDIPAQDYYNVLQYVTLKSNTDFENLMICAVQNGIPLPKEHGRLIDAEIVWNKLKELEEHYQEEFLKKSNVIYESAMSGRLYGFTNSKFVVQDAPTIIEADKESEVEE